MVNNICTAFTALKATISDVIPNEEAPITESGEQIDQLFSGLSIVSRMTQSIMYDLYLNKGLVNLNRQIKEILDKR